MRVKPSRPRMAGIVGTGCAIRFHGIGEGYTEPISMKRESKSELCSGIQGNTGKTGKLLNASGSETLCGELKDAARVKPSCNRELSQEVELHESIYRGRSGSNQIASQVMRSGSENFANQSKEGDAVTPSRPQFFAPSPALMTFILPASRQFAFT